MGGLPDTPVKPGTRSTQAALQVASEGKSIAKRSAACVDRVPGFTGVSGSPPVTGLLASLFYVSSRIFASPRLKA